MTTFLVEGGKAYTFEFTNYKGETDQRVVIARGMHWGETAWHKECQFFLDAFDLSHKEVRQFPVSGIRAKSFRLYTDAELDVWLTGQELAAEERGYNKAQEEHPLIPEKTDD